MNAFLFGAVGLGLLAVGMTSDPHQLQLAAKFAADDAEVARLMAEAPDESFAGRTIITDPETGEEIEVDMLAFND